jgi:hypothetical protein
MTGKVMEIWKQTYRKENAMCRHGDPGEKDKGPSPRMFRESMLLPRP